MPVKTKMLEVRTKGFSDVVDITAEVGEAVAGSGMADGIALVFVAGSTASVTSIEYESGAVADLQRAIREMAPEDRDYEHNKKWHDGNGFAHVRAAIMGPGFSVPFSQGRLTLGAWQQIVIVDHDNRKRHRRIAVQMVGDQAS